MISNLELGWAGLGWAAGCDAEAGLGLGWWLCLELAFHISGRWRLTNVVQSQLFFEFGAGWG